MTNDQKLNDGAWQLGEMNRHIEKLIEMKAESEIIRCAVNDRHVLLEWRYWIAKPGERIEPIRRWWRKSPNDPNLTDRRAGNPKA